MKLISRLFFIMIMLVVFQTGNVFAQLAGANLAAHGILALTGGSRGKKAGKNY